jgi:hypothetical protein
MTIPNISEPCQPSSLVMFEDLLKAVKECEFERAFEACADSLDRSPVRIVNALVECSSISSNSQFWDDWGWYLIDCLVKLQDDHESTTGECDEDFEWLLPVIRNYARMGPASEVLMALSNLIIDRLVGSLSLSFAAAIVECVIEAVGKVVERLRQSRKQMAFSACLRLVQEVSNCSVQCLNEPSLSVAAKSLVKNLLALAVDDQSMFEAFEVLLPIVNSFGASCSIGQTQIERLSQVCYLFNIGLTTAVVNTHVFDRCV